MEFLNFSAFLIAAFEISYVFLGTIVTGLSLFALPIPSVIIRRGHDVGISPVIPTIFTLIPVCVDLLLSGFSYLFKAVLGHGINKTILQFLVKVSANGAWTIVVISLLKPALDKEKAVGQCAAQQAIQNSRYSTKEEPVTENENARATVLKLVKKLGQVLGTALPPPIETSVQTTDAAVAIAPLIDEISDQLSYGAAATDFPEIADLIGKAFKNGGWQQGDATSLESQIDRLNITGRLLHLPFPVSDEVNQYKPIEFTQYP